MRTLDDCLAAVATATRRNDWKLDSSSASSHKAYISSDELIHFELQLEENGWNLADYSYMPLELLKASHEKSLEQHNLKNEKDEELDADNGFLSEVCVDCGSEMLLGNCPTCDRPQ